MTEPQAWIGQRQPQQAQENFRAKRRLQRQLSQEQRVQRAQGLQACQQGGARDQQDSRATPTFRGQCARRECTTGLTCDQQQGQQRLERPPLVQKKHPVSRRPRGRWELGETVPMAGAAMVLGDLGHS